MLVTDLTLLVSDTSFLDFVSPVLACPTVQIRAESEIRIVHGEHLVVAAQDDVAFETLDLAPQALLERGTGGLRAVVTSETVAVDRCRVGGCGRDKKWFTQLGEAETFGVDAR
jgi:hypothetical protein